MNLCIACKHCVKDDSSSRFNKCKKTVDFNDGSPLNFCTIHRKDKNINDLMREKYCGREGQWFEQKDPEIVKPKKRWWIF